MGKLPSEAATEIVANRQGIYGHPGQVYGVWAKLLEPILGRVPSTDECSMMLILLKCAREINAKYPKNYRDNLDDIAGYANVLYLTKEYTGEDTNVYRVHSPRPECTGLIFADQRSCACGEVTVR